MLDMDIWYVNIGSSNDREFSSCAVKTVSVPFFFFFCLFCYSSSKEQIGLGVLICFLSFQASTILIL